MGAKFAGLGPWGRKTAVAFQSLGWRPRMPGRQGRIAMYSSEKMRLHFSTIPCIGLHSGKKG